jgi:hypothetical protein
VTTSYHKVLEQDTLWLGALPGHVVVLINDVIILIQIRQFYNMFFSVHQLQKKAGILVQPPKVLLVRLSPVLRTAQVVHPRSLPTVPLHNIRVVLGTPVDSSPKLPPSNPAHM